MSDKSKEVPKPSQADEATQMAAGDWLTFAAEEQQDRKRVRWAFGVALILHFVFFLIKMPEIVAEAREAPKQKVYVVQQVRFKPPPPKQQQEIPKPKAKKVPIPDPTPDEPEPIRLEEEIEPDIEMPDTDIIFGIPEGPPPVEPTGPIRVGGDVAPPNKLFSPQPQYTEIARKARITGVVIV